MTTQTNRVLTPYGAGLLRGRLPDGKVQVSFNRQSCTDPAMLEKYKGNHWFVILEAKDVQEIDLSTVRDPAGR
jgi:hypothetical protein